MQTTPEVFSNFQIEDLRKTLLFSRLNNPASADRLISLLQKKTVPKNTRIFQKGDKCNSLYIIGIGSVMVHDGEYVFNVLVTGEIFGEYALIDGDARSASVTAISEVGLLELDKTVLAKYPELRIDIITSLVHILTSRLRLYNNLESKLAESHDNIRKKNDEIHKQKEEIRQQNEEIKTQRDQLEAVNRELEKLSIVARETTNAVTIMDNKGNYLWVNEGFNKIYGYTLDEMLSNSESNTYHKLSSSSFKQMLGGITINKSLSFEVQKQTKAGDKLWVSTTLTPIFDGEGLVTKLVAIDSNINELKQAENEIRQQKEEILTQNEKLHEVNNELSIKNQRVFDSISYAQRIQAAMLPFEHLFADYFTDFFHLYLPKDIVSGDFYWTKVIENDNTFKRYLILAVADCTGHGVPGAMMSMLGMATLSDVTARIDHDNEEISAGNILFHLRKQIISSLKQTGKWGEQKDGMDMAICVFDIDELSDQAVKKVSIRYSGANLPVLIATRDAGNIPSEDTDVVPVSCDDDAINAFEIKPDKMPIGIMKKCGEGMFKNHTFNVNKGDAVFMTSDGFGDQEGIISGERYQRSRLRKLLAVHSCLPMNQIKTKLTEELALWKNGYSQTDDITVLGIRL